MSVEYQLLIVGLTGGIASGKTTVSNLFAEKGVSVIDADVVAHRLVQPGQMALTQLKEIFGSEICYSDGTLNRDKLRHQVFNNPTQRKQLEAILHPQIIQTMWTEVAQLKEKITNHDYCLFSVPLLVETQLIHQVDRVLVVDCTPETQQKRLKIRNHFTAIEIAQIIASQATRENRLAVATEVINNDSTQEALATQVHTLHNHYLTLATSNFP